MTRHRGVFLIVSVLCSTLLVAGSWLAAQESRETPGADSLYKYIAVFTEAFSRVRNAHVEESEVDELFAAAFDGVADALDPFTAYVPASGEQRFVASRAVGASRSGLHLLRERGIPYVLGVDPGSPAALAGVEAGDLVAEIDGRSTRRIPLWEAQSLLAQPLGRSVKLQLVRVDQPVDVEIRLAEYDRPRPELEFEGDGDDTVAVLRVVAFDETVVADTRKLLEVVRERGIDRLLVDLRSAHRGEPAAAYPVASLFADGELGGLWSRDGATETFRGAAPAFSGRLVVLIDRSTLGPGEVLAQVLRRSASATLVGEKSFGYAGHQRTVPLTSGGLWLLTDGFYAAADGERLNEGLRPDVPFEERSRTFAERDVPRRELLYQRALTTLRAAPPAEAAAPVEAA